MFIGVGKGCFRPSTNEESRRCSLLLLAIAEQELSLRPGKVPGQLGQQAVVIEISQLSVRISRDAAFV